MPPSKKKREKKTESREVVAIVLALLTVIFLCLLFSYDPSDVSANTSSPNNPAKNIVGIVGAWVAYAWIFLFGFGAYLIPIMLGGWATAIFRDKTIDFLKVAYCCLILIMASAIFNNASGLYNLAERLLGQRLAGGIIGQTFAYIIMKYLGFVGGTILIISILLVTVFLLTEVQAYPILKKIWEYCKKLGCKAGEMIKAVFFETSASKNVQGKVQDKEPAKESLFKFPFRDKKEEPKKPVISPEKIKISHTTLPEKLLRSKKKKIEENTPPLFSVPVSVKPSDVSANDVPVLSSKGEKKFEIPKDELLDDPRIVSGGGKEEIQKNAEILVQVLTDFGIEVTVEEITKGPSVTRYEIRPAPGVGVSKIKSKEHDIALAMSASSIRIVAPIPGKAAVGIEVPNKGRHSVCMKEVRFSEEYKYFEGSIPIAIGKDVAGMPVIGDLSQMPHVLIAGATGSGKTVCINALIMSILMSQTPEQVKMLLIDPKMVELKKYNGIPHLISPVITNAKKAVTGLHWAVKEMEKRFNLFSKVGVNDIVRFNSRDLSIQDSFSDKDGEEESVPNKLPYIVILIDELADLMMTASVDVETSIVRLAQLSRAVGIHLVVATQRPSVDVITGLIKANFPVRIAFEVSSKVDSRTILDGNGAEALLGKGDLLYNPPGSSKLVRAQGVMVSDKEIKKIIHYWKQQGVEEHSEDIISTLETKSNALDYEDDLYDEAVRIVLNHGQASASVLQRRLRIGYARAARLVDIMEDKGIVGSHRGSKGREILVDTNEYFSKDVSTSDDVNDKKD